MSITTRTGTITHINELTETAREIIITLNEPLDCPPGSFVNFFMDVNGAPLRRAYSVVRADDTQKTITLSVRRSINGTMTTEFWKDDIIGRPVKVMGPMGFNTSDKLTHETLNLFAYGIGAGVIRAILDDALTKPFIKKITVTTGSRNENDVVYKTYFDSVTNTHKHVSVRYVISDPLDQNYPYKGYVQDHISDISFNDSDIYMCGQEKACDALLEKIKATNPTNIAFFVESFH